MFSERPLGEDLERVRETHAPDAHVLDASEDFETLAPARAEQLGLVVEAIDPASAPAEWVPDDAPEILHQYASDAFTVGAPGDGGVAWTRQTEPPVVIVKPRLADSPDAFVEFLIAEALVEVGLEEPEQFLYFFRERYPAFQAASTPYLDPVGSYQLAAACHDAYLGLATRAVFAGWEEAHTGLGAAWSEAGERLEPRVSELPEAMSAGRTAFGDAAELACSAVKHGIELPAPFDALDASAYREHGPEYALRWAERTIEALQ